jgi:hypothetical protein
MTKQVQLRRGTTAEHAVFTGALAELTVDTDKKVAVVHDGVTVGGNELVGVAATGQTIVNKDGLAIGTSEATSPLTVIGNSFISGNSTFGSDLSVEGKASFVSLNNEPKIQIGFGNTTLIVGGTAKITESLESKSILVNNLNAVGYGITIFGLDTLTRGNISSGSTVITIRDIANISIGDFLNIPTYLESALITGIGTGTSDLEFNAEILSTNVAQEIGAGSTIIPLNSISGVSIGNSITFVDNFGEFDEIQLVNVPIVGFTTVSLDLVDQFVTTTSITSTTGVSDTIIAVASTSSISIGNSFSVGSFDQESLEFVYEVETIPIIGFATVTVDSYEEFILSTITTEEVGIGSDIIPVNSTLGITTSNLVNITIGISGNIEDPGSGYIEGGYSSVGLVNTPTEIFVVTSVSNPGTPPPDNVYAIDGDTQKELTLVKGNTYRFDVSDSSLSTHPLIFQTTSGDSLPQEDYVVVYKGSTGSSGAFVDLIIKPSAQTETIKYNCAVHDGMGANISVTTGSEGQYGSGLVATLTVDSNGEVSNVAIDFSGIDYKVNDSLGVYNGDVGGTGSGFEFVVLTVGGIQISNTVVGFTTDTIVVGTATTILIPEGSSVSITEIRTDGPAIELGSPVGVALTTGTEVLITEPVFPVVDAVLIGIGDTISEVISVGSTASISEITTTSPAVIIDTETTGTIPDNSSVEIRRLQQPNSNLNVNSIETEFLNTTGITTISGFTFPTQDGLKGQSLVTDGLGNIEFGSGGGGGGEFSLKVSQSTGDDSNDGTILPVKTIKRASQIASLVGEPATIFIESGDYLEDNPIILYDEISVIGDSLRNVVVRPQNAGKDLFRVRNGNYVTGMTFNDFVDGITKVPQHTWNYSIAFDDPYDIATDRTGYACTGILDVTNAIYNEITGITSITTSEPHELYRGTTARVLGIGWTCGYDETGISTFTYNNETGISTITLREEPSVLNVTGDKGYEIGGELFLHNLPFACTEEHAGITTTIFPYEGLDDTYGSVYDIIGINTAQRTITIQGGISTIPHVYIGWQPIGISTFEYTETTGISTVVTVQPHGFEANDNITLIDLPFSCASEHIGVTTTLFPDGSGEYKFTFKVSEVIDDTTFVFTAGISTIAHIYEGFGEVGISTFEYTNATGVSTAVTLNPHGLEEGDYVTLNGLEFSCSEEHVGVTTTIFPDGSGPYGYTFLVTDVTNTTTFTFNAGISTISHTYETGGTAKKVPITKKVPTIQRVWRYPDRHKSGRIDFGVVAAVSPTKFIIRGETIPGIPHFYTNGGTVRLTKPKINKSPYIQNCSILSALGGNGILVDGDKIIDNNRPLIPELGEIPAVGPQPEFGKSMVAATFTMISFGGIGWRTINDGYAQVVSCFQIFCKYGSLTQSGGYLSITNSATNFGSFALRSTGFSRNSFEFDRGRVVAAGVQDGLQTLRVIGLGRSDQQLYVLRFINNAGADETSLFKPLVQFQEFTGSQVDVENNIFNIAAHPFQNLDSVIYSGVENQDPPQIIEGLINGGVYFVQFIDASSFKLFFDEGLETPVSIGSTFVGINTITRNNQEFFVDEIVDQHQVYQSISFASTSITPNFVSGRQVIQTVTGGNAVGFALTYSESENKLIVSTEAVGGIRNLFNANGGDILDHSDTPVSIGVTAVAGINTLTTINFKLNSTVTGNVLAGIANLPENYRCHFHRPSIINSSAHTWEYSGSGIDYNALPQNGGKSRPKTEQVSEVGGRVFASGTNELGDFKIGDQITAFNRTGNIIFNNKVTIGELASIRLSLSGGVAVDEFSTDVQLGETEVGGPQNSRVSTQLAVRSFLSNRLGTFIDKTVSANAIPNSVVQLNANGQINPDLIPPKVVQFTQTPVEGDGRLVLVNRIPAINIIQGDTVVQPDDSYVLINDTKSQFLVLDNDNVDFTFENDDEVISALSSAVVGVLTAPPQGIGIGTTVAPYVGYGTTGLVKGVSLLTEVTAGGSGYLTPGIYTGVPASTITGVGTDALINVTIGAGGNVTNVDLLTGGRYYSVDDVISVNDSNLIGGRSGGSNFQAKVTSVQTRLYLRLTNNQKFQGSPALADFIQDGNAVAISTSLSTEYSEDFNPTDVLQGGDINFANGSIVVGPNDFADGDPVIYDTLGNDIMAAAGSGIFNLDTYYIKMVGAGTSVELHRNYQLNNQVIFTGSGTGTHRLRRSVVNIQKDTVVFVNHPYETGTPVRTSGDTPTGISTGQFLYCGSVTQNSFTFHGTQSDALASVNGVTFNQISIGGTHSGTFTLSEQNVRYQNTVNTSSTDINNWTLLASGVVTAENIVSGTISPTRLGSGNANSDTVLTGTSEYVKNVFSVGIGTTQPMSATSTSTDFPPGGVGIVTHYGKVNLLLNRVAPSIDTFSTLGVARFRTSTFDIGADGAISIKTSATGDVDAATLGGVGGAFYLDAANHTGSVPLSRGGTGLTGVPANGAILIGNGTAYNLTTTPTFTGNVTIQSNLSVTGTATLPTIGGNTSITGTVTANGPMTLSQSPFYRNVTTIASNYTIATTHNEMSAGPITINNGITVTVNGDWSIV